MTNIRLKLAELYELEGDSPVPQPGTGDIERLVLKRYGFLPQPLIVVVEGDEVLLSFPEESAAAQAEAKRLTERAEKRAAEGHYEKAIGILKRALELQSSYHGAEPACERCSGTAGHGKGRQADGSLFLASNFGLELDHQHELVLVLVERRGLLDLFLGQIECFEDVRVAGHEHGGAT